KNGQSGKVIKHRNPELRIPHDNSDVDDKYQCRSKDHDISQPSSKQQASSNSIFGKRGDTQKKHRPEPAQPVGRRLRIGEESVDRSTYESSSSNRAEQKPKPESEHIGVATAINPECKQQALDNQCIVSKNDVRLAVQHRLKRTR